LLQQIINFIKLPVLYTSLFVHIAASKKNKMYGVKRLKLFTSLNVWNIKSIFSFKRTRRRQCVFNNDAVSDSNDNFITTPRKRRAHHVSPS